MNILLTGIDGYIGWPTSLRLAATNRDARIVAVDNLARRQWVEECGATSAIPIADIETRIAVAKTHGFTNISFVQGDLTQAEFVHSLVKENRPDVIIHLAAQPSAPYSDLNGTTATFTQYNNNQSTTNLLWAIKEADLTDHTHFIETTTMGVYGAPEFDIPEGFLDVERRGKRDTIPFPSLAGSWYHTSKGNDINNLQLSNRLWGLSISDLRTGIVYGTQTDEMNLDSQLATRFDFDYYFGVVGNRFCAMALVGAPILVYGKGMQWKPQISLEDCVQTIVAAADRAPDGEYRVYNQTTEPVSIVGLAGAVQKAARLINIQAEVRHIANPRVEKEVHTMEIDTANFQTLLGSPRLTIGDGMLQVLKSLTPHRRTIEAHQDRFLPPELKNSTPL